MALAHAASKAGPLVVNGILFLPVERAWLRQLLNELSLDEKRNLVEAVLGESLPSRAPSLSTTRLSRRERDVAKLIAQGLSNRDIADALVLSVRTVEAHVTHVLSKLGLRSRAQIAVWAAQQMGQVTPPSFGPRELR
ncbi:MAG TPA: LuxR C-terminal-related transcriptional regulator [Chloroflexota bacterium]|jgi:DNA-binding NarL/FixJ family response regulator